MIVPMKKVLLLALESDARNALDAHDAPTARAACSRLLLSLRTIHRKEVPSAGNIF